MIGAPGAVFGPIVHVGSLLLVFSGVAKLRRPTGAANALAAVGLPAARVAARVIAAVELATGALCLVSPDPASLLVLAGVYAAFAFFVAFLLWGRIEVPSCGCAGSSDTPPSAIHVALNAVAAVGAAAGAAREGVPSLLESLRSTPFAGAPYAVGIAALALVAYAAVVHFPIAFRSLSRSPRGAVAESNPARALRADRALGAAGVGRGHPSLWPASDRADLDHAPAAGTARNQGDALDA